jgi:hypothetical protein
MGAMDSLTRSRSNWRRLAACVLVFALVLQSLAFNLAIAHRAADETISADLTGFELCRHDPATPVQPGDPGSPAADSHCVFCVAGPGFVLEPPTVSTVFCPVEISTTPWPLVAWRLAPVTVDASTRPRGPPAAA